KLGEAREGRSAEQVRVNAAKEDLDKALHNMERVQQSPQALAEELGERAELGEISEALYGETEQNLDKAKAEREEMGAVNLVADSEVEELEALIAEVKKERDDVEKTVNSLRQSIRHINKEARGKLMDAFEKVNQHFGALFASLFGGGKAYLQFSGSDDPLEAELEIIATPPGKKPKTLSLLSGGEQTLTALSLLFSVFLTNPSPICVLDEADAPLDEANVARLCTMLEEIIKKTNIRFIIITHHAYTMAKANRLYGVTMQEQGVSFVASLNLKDAAQHAISPENQQNQHSINAENAS
ncbi:MAG: chromosome segregation protein SMC, partial [Parvibaculales bacterium]